MNTLQSRKSSSAYTSHIPSEWSNYESDSDNEFAELYQKDQSSPNRHKTPEKEKSISSKTDNEFGY